jgi:hypothetical protein
MVAGGIIFALYSLFSTSTFSFLIMPISLAVGVLGVSLAFLKINDRPFEYFLISAVKSFFVPNRRVWIKEDVYVPEETQIPIPKGTKEINKKANLKDARTNLQKLATLVDTGYQSSENRITNTKSTAGEEKINDILGDTEKKSDQLDRLMENAKNSTSKNINEMPISALSTVKPSDSNFSYQDISLKSEEELEEMINKTKEKQIELENKLKSSKIEKF